MLVKTSNPSSGELQNRDMEGKPLYARMAEMVAKWGEGLDTPCGYNQIGAVVGATYPEEQKIIRELLPKSTLPPYRVTAARRRDRKGHRKCIQRRRSRCYRKLLPRHHVRMENRRNGRGLQRKPPAQKPSRMRDDIVNAIT